MSVENQSAAIPATAGKPSDMLLNAPSKLQESSPTQTLEISKTVAFKPGRIVTGYYPGSKEGHIPTRSASEGSGAFPSLARRVNMQQHA